MFHSCQLLSGGLTNTSKLIKQQTKTKNCAVASPYYFQEKEGEKTLSLDSFSAKVSACANKQINKFYLTTITDKCLFPTLQTYTPAFNFAVISSS